ncbi:MAG: flagellar biosynthetic protein FliO [Candidatus Zixiibacteriota bacterium]
MRTKSKKILLIILIVLIVSAAFIAAKFGAVSASDTAAENYLYKTAETNQSDNEQADAVSMAETDSMTSALVKLLGALTVVIIGIYGFLLMLRKMMGRKFSGSKKNRLLEVIETTYVAPKKSVSLVRFADRTVLIGVAENNISVLAEINSEETSKIMARTEVDTPSKAGFSSILNEARGKLIGLNMKGLRVLNSAKKTGDGTQAA